MQKQTPNVFDMKRNPEYWRDTKNRQLLEETMTPQEYLRLVDEGFEKIGSGGRGSLDVDQTLVDEYAAAMERGDLFPPLQLDYTRGDFSQEGRHRAHAAIKAGIDDVPVQTEFDRAYNSRGALDMSQTARMARAEDMGFDTDKTWYHGTFDEFDEFRTTPHWAHFGLPEQANARLRNTRRNKEGYMMGENVKGENVMPVHLKAKNPLLMEDVGQWEDSYWVLDEILGNNRDDMSDEAVEALEMIMNDPEEGVKNIRDQFDDWAYSLENEQALEDIAEVLKSEGFDAIDYENSAEGAGISRLIFDPEQVRSINAEFDPAKASSGNIMSNAGVLAEEKRAYG